MLIGYFDESHDPSRRHSKWYAVGGFIAAAAEWERFTQSWNERLASDRVTGRLHMREFEHGIGHFDGWSQERRYQLIADLVDIINGHGLFGIGQAVDVEAFERVFVPALPAKDAATFGRPYVFCLQVCLEHIVAVRDILEVPPDETVDLVFDQNRELANVGARHYRAFIEHMEWDQQFGSLTFSSGTLAPLQAADVFAYETFKHVTNQFTNGQPQRDTRKLIKRLMDTERHRGGYHDEEELVRLVQGARAAGHIP